MNRTPTTFCPHTLLAILRGETPRERLLHRLHSVALVLGGLSASAVGRLYGHSARAVAYWVTRFHAEGVRGLEEEARPGRPSKLNPKQRQQVAMFVARSERTAKSVNAGKLAAFILTEFDVVLTPRQCWRILNKLKS